MRFKRTSIAVAVALSIGTAGVLTYQHWPSSRGSTVVLTEPLVPSPIQVAKITSAPVDPAAAAPTPLPGETRTAMVNRLIKSADQGNAKDAFDAFKVLQTCLSVKGEAVQRAQTRRPELWVNVPTEAQACEGLDAGQLTSAHRLTLQAAEAGIPGAFSAARGTGAFDGPETYDRVQQAAISKGDTAAMRIRSREILDDCKQRCTDDQNSEVVKLRVAADIIEKAEGHSLGPMPSTTTRILASLGARGAQATEAGRELARATKGVTQ